MKLLKIFLLIFVVSLASCNDGNKDAETDDKTAELSAEEQSTDMSDKLMSINDDLFTAWNNNDKELMASHLAEDFTRFANGENDLNGRDAYLSMMDSLHTSFPDLSIIEKETTSTGNQTFGSFTFKGTNNGKFLGNPATGKEVSVEGFAIWTFNDQRKATKEQVYFDRMTWLSQMGYVTTPPEVK
ncbi:MAG: ester cyclase [Gramella sp.]|nr:ester cyclase [Christiangramia sp.]